MFCPECGAEYREGFYQCSDCQVPLVSEPPSVSRQDQPIEDLQLVTLIEIENPIHLALVRSVLEADGIECMVQGESPHALAGIEFVSRRKKAVLQIAKEDETRARALLEAIEFPEDDINQED